MNFPLYSVLLDTTDDQTKSPKKWLFTNPIVILETKWLSAVPSMLREIEIWVQRGFYAAGFFSYEAGFAFESHLQDDNATRPASPLIWFGIYETYQEADDLFGTIPENTATIHSTTFDYTEGEYAEKIAQIKHLILEGDVYQINFTGKLRFDVEGEAWALYRALRAKQRVAYSAFIHTGTQQILSFSPELFFHRKGNELTVRPMKGTIKRGKTIHEDDAFAEYLQNDPKNRAENLMIVDLLRNDLSKICRPQSVETTELFTIETYQTLLQMTSTVKGTLQPETSYQGIFKALFPSGSITGAPKIRAMQAIQTLETSPRGIYCGTIGFIAPSKGDTPEEAVFNVAIRTLVVENGKGEMGIGSGIVWDSEAAAEFAECQLKAQFLTTPTALSETPPFQLIEAIRYENGYAFLDKHLARMKHSATYFGFPFSQDGLTNELLHLATTLQADVRHKVRVLLDAQGTFSTQANIYQDFSTFETNYLKMSESVVSSDHVFLYHKTTQRNLYESEYQKAVAEGFREVFFVNERGELTEGSRTNIFLEKEGIWFTPSLSSGVLKGVYRQHLIEQTPHIVEKVLYLDDLLNADAVYCCNVLRGMERMYLPDKKSSLPNRYEN